VVDEVLAVGDAAFQKKCLGKMGDVAKEGRTVLFVSHNMAAIQHLCERSILLDNGKVHVDGQTEKVVDVYLGEIETLTNFNLSERHDRAGEGKARFTQIKLLDENHTFIKFGISGRALIIRLYYNVDQNITLRQCRVSVSVHRIGVVYFLASTELVRTDELIIRGQGYVDCLIYSLPLSKGSYYMNPFLESNGQIQDYVEASAILNVADGDFYGTGRNYPAGWEGKGVLVRHEWVW